MKSRPHIYLAALILALAAVGWPTGEGTAAETRAVNPTGTWKVTLPSTNTQARPAWQALKLKLNGGTLTGTLNYRSGPMVNGKSRLSELPITAANIQGSDISFNFTHPPASGNGPGASYSYQSKISSDTIKGTFTTEWMGDTRTRGWEAKRVKEWADARLLQGKAENQAAVLPNSLRTRSVRQRPAKIRSPAKMPKAMFTGSGTVVISSP